jgi:hypothetical protein
MEQISTCGLSCRWTVSVRPDTSLKRVSFVENTRVPCARHRPRILKYGSPIRSPSALASGIRATAQPSLFESTISGTGTASGVWTSGASIQLRCTRGLAMLEQKRNQACAPAGCNRRTRRFFPAGGGT